MFEFIGIVVVFWLGFAVIKSFFTANSRIQGQEVGKEARYIAINELKVPKSYYNHEVMNNMEEVKQGALGIKEQVDKDFSWPRLLAFSVYGSFRHDCEQFHYGNPIAENRLRDLGVSQEEIVAELNRDTSQILN